MTARSGWAYGFTSPGGEWLTIVGSAISTPKLTAEPADAETALAETKLPRFLPGADRAVVVAHVTEMQHPGVTGNGMAYRITPGTAREISRAQEGA